MLAKIVTIFSRINFCHIFRYNVFSNAEVRVYTSLTSLSL